MTAGRHILKGICVSPLMDPVWVEKMKEVSLRFDDVWVVCYPKCGTNWMAQIVRLILNKGRDDGKKLSDAVPWVEGFHKHYSVNLDEMSSPRVFRSHFPYELMPCGLPNSTPGKYIYVCLLYTSPSPRDATLSRMPSSA